MDKVEFILATTAHFDDFFKLKSEPNNIFWSGFDSAPNYEEFKIHFEKELTRDDRTIIFLYFNKAIAGYLYIDFCDVKKEVSTGHGVLKDFSGKGLGRKLIKYAVDFSTEKLTQADKLIGWIAEDNIGSIKNVLSNGYEKSLEIDMRVFSQREVPVKFEKYIFDLIENRNSIETS